MAFRSVCDSAAGELTSDRAQLLKEADDVGLKEDYANWIKKRSLIDKRRGRKQQEPPPETKEEAQTDSRASRKSSAAASRAM